MLKINASKKSSAKADKLTRYRQGDNSENNHNTLVHALEQALIFL
jgi:hypothetical protein